MLADSSLPHPSHSPAQVIHTAITGASHVTGTVAVAIVLVLVGAIFLLAAYQVRHR